MVFGMFDETQDGGHPYLKRAKLIGAKMDLYHAGYGHIGVDHNISLANSLCPAGNTRALDSEWNWLKESLPHGCQPNRLRAAVATYTFVRRCRLRSLDPTVEFIRAWVALFESGYTIADFKSEFGTSGAENIQSDDDKQSDVQNENITESPSVESEFVHE